MLKRGLLVFISALWASSAFAQRDAIDLSRAVVWNSPADVASWPATTRVESLTMSPASAPEPGLALNFSGRSRWPNYTPPGWDGPIQYTIWAGVRINGVWHVSGFIQMWRDRPATGAPILTRGPGCSTNNFACNWAYDGRWGAMNGYQPSAGEAMIFFATAGNARGVRTVTSVRERTNVVMVNLPANDTGTFTFSGSRSDLVVDLEAEGLWTLFDATTYNQIAPGYARGIISGGDIDGNQIEEVVADYGAGGLWIRWNGTTWTQLHPGTANAMVLADIDGNGLSDVVVGFADAGLWAFVNARSWVQLHQASPIVMAAGDIDGGGDDLIMSYAGQGVWIRRNSGAWAQLHPSNPREIVTGDFDGNGRADMVLSFVNEGTWMVLNASTWARVHPSAALHLAVGDVDGSGREDLLMDFGGPVGIWLLRNLLNWLPVHGQPAEQIVLADLDGNGQDDILIDFGPGTGVWILVNSSTWAHATSSSPRWMRAGHFN